jgi:mRNA interferase MazF
MQKDFDSWNENKKKLNSTKRDLLFKEGEIWWCSIGMNIGEEVYGKGINFRRPVIIFKKLSHNSCIVIPTTTQSRMGTWYHHLNVNLKDRWAMMNQIKFISANRLFVRESFIPESDFIELKKSVATLLGLNLWSPSDARISG